MKLDRLTKQEKIELLKAIEEKRARDALKRPPYKPNVAQLKVVASRALERFLFCANGFGKSTILVNEVHWAATGFNPITGEHTPVPCKMALVLDDPAKINDFLTEYRKWNKLEPEWTSKRGKPEISAIEWPNGSTLTVLTHAVEPLKLEGSQWTHAFYDEPPPKYVYQAIYRGMRVKDRPGRVLMAGTPLNAPWLRTDIWEPWVRGELPHVECFRGRTDDNAANLEAGYIERFSKLLSDKEKEIRLAGEFGDLDGLALSHLYRESVHVIPASDFVWQSDWPCVVAIDPHPSKKHVAILLGADRDNRLYVLKELSIKAVARDFARELKAWYRDFRIIDIVCDSLGSADMTGGEGFKSFIQVLRESGVPARATTFVEKEDEAFIARIQDSLLIPSEPDNFGQLVPKLRILSTCPMVISDVRNVQWVRDKRAQENKPKLDISNKDALACLKYALATNLYHAKPAATKPHYVRRAPYGLPPPVRGKIKTLHRRKTIALAADDDDDW